MNKLAIWLAKEVLGKVQGATQGYSSINPEYRLIFRGPPLEILEQTYSDLTQNGGIHIQGRQDGSKATLPVLLSTRAISCKGPSR